jgi:hypothetical protein
MMPKFGNGNGNAEKTKDQLYQILLKTAMINKIKFAIKALETVSNGNGNGQ